MNWAKTFGVSVWTAHKLCLRSQVTTTYLIDLFGETLGVEHWNKADMGKGKSIRSGCNEICAHPRMELFQSTLSVHHN